MKQSLHGALSHLRHVLTDDLICNARVTTCLEIRDTSRWAHVKNAQVLGHSMSSSVKISII